MVKPTRKLWSVLILGIATLLPASLLGQDSDLRPVATKYAIKNATIVQAPGRVIQKGTVVFENGVIKSVGSNVSIPADAWVIDADSMYVYAGFISGISNIGVPKPKEDKERLDSKLKQNPPNEKAGITPGQSAADLIDLGEKSISEFRELGFTAALVAPHQGMFSGKSSFILLGGGTPESLLMKKDMSLYAQLNGASGMYPATVIGVMAKHRDMIRKAKQSYAYQGQYSAANSGMERPVRDPDIEALFPVVNGQIPLVMKTPDVLDIMRAITLKKDLGYSLQLAEVKQAWDALDEIRASGATVFLSLDLPEMKEEKEEKKEAEGSEEKKDEEKKEKSADDMEKEALEKRQKEMIAKYYKAASDIQAKGIPFAFSTLEVKSKDFKKNLGGIIKAGLTEDQALAALTTSPAKIHGVSGMMGTVEAGKMANLVITDKPYFDEKSNVRYVFVDGVLNEYEVKKEKKKKKGTGEDINPNGSYDYSYSSAEGETWNGTFSISGSKDNWSGTLYLSFNDSNNDLEDIEVSGNVLSFSFTVDAGGQSVEVTVSMEFDGDSFEGSLTAGPFGSYELEGTKKPGQ